MHGARHFLAAVQLSGGVGHGAVVDGPLLLSGHLRVLVKRLLS
jgi:hypothetical protein